MIGATSYYLVATYDDGQYFISCVDDDTERWVRSKEVYYFKDYVTATQVAKFVKDGNSGTLKSVQLLWV